MNYKFLSVLGIALALLVACGTDADDDNKDKKATCNPEDGLSAACLDGDWHLTPEIGAHFVIGTVSENFTLSFLADSGFVDLIPSQTEASYGDFTIPEEHKGKVLRVTWSSGPLAAYTNSQPTDYSVTVDSLKLEFAAAIPTSIRLYQIANVDAAFKEVFLKEGVTVADIVAADSAAQQSETVEQENTVVE
jgi:hypothetical protein